jgi:hypothetical protein
MQGFLVPPHPGIYPFGAPTYCSLSGAPQLGFGSPSSQQLYGMPSVAYDKSLP